MPKIKIDRGLYEKIKECAEMAGYSTPEEFAVHALEKEVSLFENAENDPAVLERLKGLGYI
jgi:hypothetical protein